MKTYSPVLDNEKANKLYQGIPQGSTEREALKTDYPSIDKLQNATINDNFIYITTHDAQHARVSEGEKISKSDGTGFSYFTNEETIKGRVSGELNAGTFDSYGLHRDLCVGPHSSTGLAQNASDKGHLDCFYVDRDRMEQIYGTRDFNAAIGKCNANNHYGSDGGDQGYNAALTELYNNGCLKYVGTYDAEPGSTLKCRSEFGKMHDAREEKCSAILSGSSQEDVQKIGYPLDERCHQKTTFNSEPIENLQEKYKDYRHTYNREMAESTTKDDRKFKGTMNNTPEQKNLADGAAVTNKLPEKQAESGPVTRSDIPQPPNPKQNVGTEPVGAKKEDLPEIKSPKTADQSAVGPQNPSQITSLEDSTTLKNLSGNKDPNMNPENEAVSAATKAAGGMHNG